ncbi:MAG: diguanylate cyclase [Rhodospirillales bacterium]|nr:diguanylate cyclase [Rhodospirillales bacterium]
MPDDQVFPPLTVADAESIVQDLEKALDAHYSWVRRFQAMLVCRTLPAKDDLASDGHLRDEFGRWYHHSGNEHLRHHPDYQTLGRHHRELHQIARQLAQIAKKRGKVPANTYRSFQRNIDRFRTKVNRILNEAREQLRFSDPLTGIATRFAMLPRLDQERERVSRTGEHSSVGMVAIDKFKNVNDTYGHNAGDIVLQEVANYLLANLRRYDQICRYGGEEFLIMLPSTHPRRAKRVLDRLRRGLKRRRMSIGEETEISVTASFGIAALTPQDSIMAAIDHADQAMYTAKKDGRNRVRIWPDDDTEPPPENRKK